jgi:hypothetical protein
MTDDQWSLELAKLAVSALTPILVLILTFMITRYMKTVEQRREQLAKLGEKRMELYDQIGVKLNEVFCYFWYVGKWKHLSPEDVIERKRELDAVVHTYRPFFSQEFYGLYRQFVTAAFSEYATPGEDAKLRTTSRDRAQRYRGEWKEEWSRLLTDEDNSNQIRRAYEALLARLAAELELSSSIPRGT